MLHRLSRVAVVLIVVLTGSLVAASPAQAASPCVNRLINYYNVEMTYSSTYGVYGIWTTNLRLRVPYSDCNDISVWHEAVMGAPRSTCPLYRVRATKSTGEIVFGNWFGCTRTGWAHIYTDVKNNTLYEIQVIVPTSERYQGPPFYVYFWLNH